VRAITLGIVNPHKMVDDEVKKSLAEIDHGEGVDVWVVGADRARIAFGLTLWVFCGALH